MDIDKQRKIEKYFDYYWSANKNQAIDEQEEINMLNQLPVDTQNILYQEYLYKKFLTVFQDLFKIKKKSFDLSDEIFYSWENP